MTGSTLTPAAWDGIADAVGDDAPTDLFGGQLHEGLMDAAELQAMERFDDRVNSILSGGASPNHAHKAATMSLMMQGERTHES
jgi:hypothetical protein